MEWFRFALTAVLLLSGLFVIFTAVVAQFRFHYALNRIHAASMADSLGLLLILSALCVSANDGWMVARYLLVILFLWITSPTGGHLIARLEITLNKHPEKEMEIHKL